MTPNEKAFLDCIAWSEGTSAIPNSDDGYLVLVGSTAKKPLLFAGYADHPNIYNKAANSTAAGRYQLLHRWWAPYKKMLNLPDFTPASQDAVALQQIKESHALEPINAGNLSIAVARCAHIWASLPGAGYGQHENKYSDLRLAYIAAGGKVLDVA